MASVVLHQKLCKEKVLHGDETTLQVLHKMGMSATSRSYMWLYLTSRGAEKPILLYDYQPNRKAEMFLDVDSPAVSMRTATKVTIGYGRTSG